MPKCQTLAAVLAVAQIGVLSATTSAQNPTPQVAVESRIIETTKNFSQEVGVRFGLAAPMGDFSDNAGAGFHLGAVARQQVTPNLSVGMSGGWTFFGGKDRVSEGFGEPSIGIFQLGSEVEWLLRAVEKSERSGSSLVNPSIIAGGGVSSLAFTQDFSQNNIPDFKGAETAPWLFGGLRVTRNVGDDGILGASATINHTFTQDGGENWLALSMSYSRPLVAPWTDGYAHRNQAWSDRLIGPFSTVGLRTMCGLPIGDFDNGALPGLGFGLLGEIPLRDELNAIIGGSYQTYGNPGSQDDNNDRSINSIDFKVGLQRDVRIPNTNLDTYAQVALSPVFLSESQESGGQSFDNDDSGIFLLGGLGVRRAVSDRVTVGLLTDIPIISFLFDHDSPKKARAEVIVTLTPRILKGGEGQ